MFNIFQDKYKYFWKWFEKHSEIIFTFDDDRENIFDMLGMELRKINKNLTFELSSIKNGKRDFVISADGILETFPVVEKLYEMKPNLEKWNILKFRQRKNINFIVNFSGISVNPEDVRYVLTRYAGEKIALFLFIKNYEENNTFHSIGYLFLDNALGEYDMETKVGGIDFFDWNAENFELSKPIDTLADDFDKMCKEVKY